MAATVKLLEVAPGLFQHGGSNVSASEGCSFSRPLSFWWRCQGNPIQGLCKGRQYRLLVASKPISRTSKTLSFKQFALPLDRASTETDNEPAEQADEEPWLGAILFKRSAIQTHYEFQTSLERLGLAILSSEESRLLANSIGVTSKSSESGTEQVTPVGISIDVTREGRDLRLDGLVRTAISLCCNRCLSPVVDRVFAEFSLLLTEKVVKEPTQQRIGVVLGDNAYHGPDDEGGDLDLDLDDKLHFPRDSKEIDLSKYLRDTVHLEIPSKSLCSSDCKGLCLTCGVNFNKHICKCVDVKVKPSWGPLEQLRRQLEEEGKEGSSDFRDDVE